VARFTVRLTPRAGTDRIDGVDVSGELKVRVRAAPVDGSANAALVRLLADVLEVSVAEIEIVGGTRDRRKVIEVGEAAAGRLRVLWPRLIK
jgi:uncharacterized protein (TIGR00251 family)